MTIQEIAEKNKVTVRFIYMVKSGGRLTEMPQLAIDLSAKTGVKPLSYIHPRFHKLFRKAMSELSRKSRMRKKP